LPDADNWSAQSKRSIARLFANYLICEDPQRRLDARQVITLSHQVSLVRHILDHDHLRRVLIADEVGLGKTVEVGLLVKELLDQNPGLRVLYLAPARLVNNVGREFDRLDLPFRLWKAGEADARLSDPRIIASIHRAVHGHNTEKILNTPAWDVIIVDECHHLSDWSAGGGDPVHKFRLVRDLLARQGPESRLLLMSGTPHQGHVHRFDNLLKLLKRPDEPDTALAGRVIYRTKEDVHDWTGNPLFPTRQINEPLVLDLGPEYRAWLQHIHDFYKPPRAEGSQHKARQRAAGWRCAQALQWAASSPNAGLGYLVRQAVRASWSLKDGVFAESLAALRPYRYGSATEPIDVLLARIRREVKEQADDADIDDIEEDDVAVAAQNNLQNAALNDLMVEGLHVLNHFGNRKWDFLKSTILDKADGEKAVLFAQPIETVCALSRYLEQCTGRKPAIIMGGQSDAERQEQQNLFWRKDGPRFLVSSRAGGEGINLQVARRLVHIDVPWNPMELEQRVGRVHRFGSRKTVIVDTIVVRDSREADAYRVAREKLRLVAASLVGPERFETIFSRVMCLVSPEELQEVLIEEAVSPLTPEDQDRIAHMVEAGFNAWREFHERFSQRRREIRSQEPGLASWEDVSHFLSDYTAAQPVDGFTASRFLIADGRIEAQDEQIRVLHLEGQNYFLGDYDGAVISAPEGKDITQLGLNVPAVTETLRKHALLAIPTGAGHLRWPQEIPFPDWLPSEGAGILVFLRQTLRSDQRIGWSEQATSLHCYTVNPDGSTTSLQPDQKATLFGAIFKSVVRTKPDARAALLTALAEAEARLTQELRRPDESEIREGVRYAVTPLFAATITT
jgi:superfamily II DNA or RNA helicase